MSDKQIAMIGRNIAHTLRQYARERRPEAQKELLQLETELCAAVRAEEQEAAEGAVREET